MMKLFNDNFLRPKDARPSGASAHHSTLKDVSTGNNRKYAYATPYIIVPAALTGVLSIFNAQDLLQRAAYVSIEEKKQQPGAKRESVVIINRAMSDGRMEQYKVIDNPRALRPEDWEHRVVAVFVSGQVWQFKDWYWSNPAELFQNILGVHLTMDGRVVDSTVQSWNCNVLKVKLTYNTTITFYLNSLLI